MLKEGQVIQLSKREGLGVVVSVSDCSARVILLNNRDWKSPDLVVESNERGVYISPGSEIEPIGSMSLSQIKSRASMAYTPSDPSKREVCYTPKPGMNPPVKRQRKARVDQIEDGSLPAPTPDLSDMIPLIKTGRVFVKLLEATASVHVHSHEPACLSEPQSLTPPSPPQDTPATAESSPTARG